MWGEGLPPGKTPPVLPHPETGGPSLPPCFQVRLVWHSLYALFADEED